jgi:ABC-type multidrug transport system fused ATPase/permease subunit
VEERINAPVSFSERDIIWKATMILVIDKGRIVQMGTHKKLIVNDSGLYKKLYELQFVDI